jgi:hypothetical protein
VCQKKNHFQITTHTTFEKLPVYCRQNEESIFHEIAGFNLNFYGVKKESHLHTVQIKQSDSERKPFDFRPVELRFEVGETLKKTSMRLHFAQTTQNNNRTRDKTGEILPNPDQRFFLLVVEVQALTKSGKSFTICSMNSERVIVRVRIFYWFKVTFLKKTLKHYLDIFKAVNPGQFKVNLPEVKKRSKSNISGSINLSNNTVSTTFNTATTPTSTDSIILKPNSIIENSQIQIEQNIKSHLINDNNKTTINGRLGINTSDPEEALHVHGNVRLTGNLLQPSDIRVKENIQPVGYKTF